MDSTIGRGEPVSPEPSAPARRAFLQRFGFGSLVALGLTYAGAVLAYLAPARKSARDSESLTDAGELADLPPGQAKVVQHGDQPVLVVRTDQGVLAFSAACTHLGCIVQYHPQGKQIVCPCHAGVFDLRGNVLAGPAPRPLPPVPAQIRDGHIYVGGENA